MELEKMIVDRLIREFGAIPNEDEQEFARRMESRRTLIEWKVRDVLDEIQKKRKVEESL